jgi:hypothetical protein
LRPPPLSPAEQLNFLSCGEERGIFLITDTWMTSGRGLQMVVLFSELCSISASSGGVEELLHVLRRRLSLNCCAIPLVVAEAAPLATSGLIGWSRFRVVRSTFSGFMPI